MAVVFDPITGKSYTVPKAPDGTEMRPPEKTYLAKDLDTERRVEGSSAWSLTFDQGEGLGVVLDTRV